MSASKTIISFEGAKRFKISGGNFGTVVGDVININSSASGSLSGSRASEGRPLQPQGDSRQAQELNSNPANIRCQPAGARQRRTQPSTSHARGQGPAFGASGDQGITRSDMGDRTSTSRRIRNTRPRTSSTTHGHNNFSSPIPPPPPRPTPSQIPADIISPLASAPVETGRLRSDIRYQRQDTGFPGAIPFGASQASNTSGSQVPESFMYRISTDMTPMALSPELFWSAPSVSPAAIQSYPRGNSPGPLPDCHSQQQYWRPNLYHTAQAQPMLPMYTTNGGYSTLTVPNVHVAHPASRGSFTSGSRPAYFTPPSVLPPSSGINTIAAETSREFPEHPTQRHPRPLPPIPTGIASASVTPYTYHSAVTFQQPHTSYAHSRYDLHQTSSQTQSCQLPHREYTNESHAQVPSTGSRGMPMILPDFGDDDPATLFARLQSQETLSEGNTLGLTTSPISHGTTIYYSPHVAPTAPLQPHSKRTDY